MKSKTPTRIRVARLQPSPRHPWVALAVMLAVGLGTSQAATFNSNFSSDPGGTPLGIAEVEDGVLKLTDLADLPPADPSKPLPQNGSYILPDFTDGTPVQSFTATFKAAVGGGSSLGAQGFSFVLANDLPTNGTFREGGGTSQGLVISFDTLDNLAGFNAEGNDPGDAPGIIVKVGGAKVAAKRFSGIQTYPANSTAARFAAVEVKLDADGTLDITYDGQKVYDNVGIGYTPIAGVFGFGSGTAELTAALRNNHWIDDVNITTASVGSGPFVFSKAPAAQNALPDSAVTIVVENLANANVALKFDGAIVTPSVSSAGNTRTITYDPPGLLSSGSNHKVELTYDTTKTFAYEFNVAKFITIPATAKAKAGSINTGSNGFRTRVSQVVAPAPGGLAAAERQLNGTGNIADLSGAAADGTFTLETINYDDDQAGAGHFGNDDVIPGYPGTNPDGNPVSDNVVIENTAYLDLPAGLVTLGVRSDDGFKVSIGGDPRDVTSAVVGSFEGVADSTFSFVVEEAGIYGVRLLWYEIGGDAHCELYSVKSDGTKILVNDRSTAGHIKAYRNRSTPAGPYISSAKPAPNEVGVNPKLNVEIVLTEDATILNPASIKLQIKDTVVTPTVTKSGKLTTISYRHPGSIEQSTYPISLTYADGPGNIGSSSWNFTTTPGPCENVSGPAATSYWTFDDGTLKATIGTDAAYIDNSISSHYSFGTSGQGAFADIPGINGKPAKFLSIPRNVNGEDFRKTGLRIKPGVAPSGGGNNANVWTLIADLYWGEGHGNGTLLRTHDLNQNNDGDLFWAQGGSYGKGCCSSYDGVDPAHSHLRNTWARVVFVADMTSTPKRFAKYINGVKHREDVTGDGANIDGRFSLPAEIYMFNDGDDNEQSDALVSAIQYRAGALTDEEVAKLGGPNEDGIPAPAVQNSGVAAQWEFNGNLQAKKGEAITYIDNSISSHYSFGTSGIGAFTDIPDINGQHVQFLSIPRNTNGEDFRKTGLRVKPGLAPSGGGKNANVWTLVADLYWGEGHGNGTLLRTHDLNQNNDGDLFWAQGGSYGKGCCSSYDGVDPAHSHLRNTWARVVFVADMTSTPKRFAKYINGFKHREDVTGDGANIDGRFSLPAEIYMFNDGDDNEQSDALVSSVQFLPKALSDAEVAALGGPSPAGIPEPETIAPSIKGHWAFDGNLDATVGASLTYIDNSISTHYSFGTSGVGEFAAIPDINGQHVQFLSIPRNTNGEDFRKTGLRVKPGLAPSGGGKNANVWTLVADLYWGEGHGNGTLLRTHDLNQNNDGDLFWAQGGSYGKGCCSSYDGVDPAHSHQRNTWARVVFVADMTSTPKRFAKYINGVKHREDVTGDGANIDGRFSLPAEIYMFNDGDDNEQSDVLVSAFQYREGALTDDEVAALGGPTPQGPPLTAAATDVCVPLAPPPPPIQLVAADVLSGPYTVVANATVNTGAKSITILAPTKTQFYRVRGTNTKVTIAVQGGNLVLTY